MVTEHTLVQIRERRFLEVLDLALVVVRGQPLVIGLAALAGIAPAAALNAWLISDPEFSLLLFALIVFLEIPWATAPLTMVLGGLMFGQRPQAGRLLRRLVQALPALFVHQLLLRTVLVVSFVFSFLIPTRLVFLNEVIVLEGTPWGKTWSRSAQLCARREGDLFGQWLAELFFGAMFVGSFWYGTSMALSALLTTEMTWEEPGWGDVYGVKFQLALWLAIAFFTVARFLTYIDHRIRKEGWETKLRLQNVARVLEETQA
jgi:hypothetical protein